MRRALLLALTTTAAVIGGFYEWTPPAQAGAASCSLLDPRISGYLFTNDLAASYWKATCNAVWNATIVLQYHDSNGWHNATCSGGAVCRRDKPSDGSWFHAGDTHFSNDQWNTTTPTSNCSHTWRLRLIAHFRDFPSSVSSDGPSTPVC